MAVPAPQRMKDIDAFKVGTSEFGTLKTVSWEETTEEISDSGDKDLVDTYLEKGKTACRGTITLSDLVQAHSIKATTGDITFKGVPETGGVAVLVTIKGCRFFNISQQAQHNGLWTVSVTFRAHDAAGGALVTVAPIA